MDTIETRKKNEQELKFDIIYSDGFGYHHNNRHI